MDTILGEIRFKPTDGVVRKYAVVDNARQGIQHTLTSLIGEWELEVPRLVISVHGCKDSFQMEGSLRQAFGRGLLKAVRTTGAWIVTDGIDTGASGQVGDAIDDFSMSSGSISKRPVVAIGIARSDSVHQNHAPSHISQIMGRNFLSLSTINLNEEEKYFLDPNHTHFILVKTDKTNVIDSYRSRIEQSLVNAVKSREDHSLGSIPLVYIILSGDKTTLTQIEFAVDRDIPVLIIAGSGKLADVLAFAYQNVRTEQDTQSCTIIIDEDVFEEIVRSLSNVLDSNDEDKARGIAMTIKDIITQKFYLLTVYQLGWSKTKALDIDADLLRSLVKAQHSVVDQLHCALLFNNAEMARNEILDNNTECLRNDMDDVAHRAILEDKVDFLEVLIDKGMNVRRFLTQGRLLYFYGVCQNYLFNNLLQNVKRHSSPISLIHIGQVMLHLIGDIYRPEYLDPNSVLDMEFSLDQRNFENISLCNIPESVPMGEPFKHLLLWSVLTSRKELSILFWKHGKDKIAAALVAYRLFRSMLHSTTDLVEKKNLAGYAEIFSKFALDVLSESAVHNDQFALRLLSSKVKNWGNMSCVELAVGTRNKHFISHEACHSILKRIWKGKLSSKNSTALILTCIVLQPIGVLLVKFKRRKTIKIPNVEENVNRGDKSVRGGYLSVSPHRLKATASAPPKEKQCIQDRDFEVKKDKAKMKNSIPFCKKLYYFYTAPIVVFTHQILMYMMFLTLYSYKLLMEMTKTITYIDMVLFFWIFTIFLEEMRQVLISDTMSMASRLRRYIKNIWNMMDVIALVLFFVGTLVRFLPFIASLDAARVILGLNLIAFFLRLLNVFSVHRRMGPKIVMIGRMSHDLMYFVAILMVFLVAYSIAAHSIIYPNSILDRHLLTNLFKSAYWNVFGELFLEDFERKPPSCTHNPELYGNNTLPRCPAEFGVYIGPVLVGAYVLFSNILLLNLLIAIFSYIFEVIHDHTDLHWHYQRSLLVMEYNTRPPLPPPFIIINHVALVIRWIVQKCRCKRAQHISKFVFDEDVPKDTPDEKLRKWENSVACVYLQRLKTEDNESVSSGITSIHHRMEELSDQMDVMFSSLSNKGARAMTLKDGRFGYFTGSNISSLLYALDNKRSINRRLNSTLQRSSRKRKDNSHRDVMSAPPSYPEMSANSTLKSRSFNDLCTGDSVFQNASPSRSSSTEQARRQGSLEDEESLAEYENKMRLWSKMQKENKTQLKQTKDIEAMVSELMHMIHSMSVKMEIMDSKLSAPVGDQ